MNAPATIARPKRRLARGSKRGGLFVTDGELIELLGVPTKEARAAIVALDANKASGFPPKNRLWGDRRYLPAVRQWLDSTNGLKIASPALAGREDGEEHFDDDD